jgi:hypothetical protein
MSMLHSQ